MTLTELNNLAPQQAKVWFSQTCAAQNWVKQMVSLRPFTSVDSLIDKAASVWQQLDHADFLEAFSAHPMIGDVNSLRAKFANTKATASAEQSGTSSASEQTLLELSQLNQQYLQQNDFIFIICATGLSAQTMLGVLKERLNNDRATEIALAGNEQIKITQLRIQKGLSDPISEKVKP